MLAWVPRGLPQVKNLFKHPNPQDKPNNITVQAPRLVAEQTTLSNLNLLLNCKLRVLLPNILLRKPKNTLRLCTFNSGFLLFPRLDKLHILLRHIT
jgi:hypothetical protein